MGWNFVVALLGGRDFMAVWSVCLVVEFVASFGLKQTNLRERVHWRKRTSPVVGLHSPCLLDALTGSHLLPVVLDGCTKQHLHYFV